MCGKHWHRFKSNGDPNISQRPTYGSGRVTKGKKGYVRIWLPEHPLAMSDGYVYEHRLVAFEAGLNVAGKHVHHRNETKDDNRPENLGALGPSAHRDEHLRGRTVKNQFGEWPVKN
jgi:hypothetical protein